MNYGGDRGSVEIVSAMGATITGAPLAVALISDNAAADNLSFIVAFLISLLTLGAGVGRIYKVWKQSIVENAKRDDLLNEVAERLANMEERQICIQEEVNRQAAIIAQRAANNS